MKSQIIIILYVNSKHAHDHDWYLVQNNLL